MIITSPCFYQPGDGNGGVVWCVLPCPLSTVLGHRTGGQLITPFLRNWLYSLSPPFRREATGSLVGWVFRWCLSLLMQRWGQVTWVSLTWQNDSYLMNDLVSLLQNNSPILNILVSFLRKTRPFSQHLQIDVLAISWLILPLQLPMT